MISRQWNNLLAIMDRHGVPKEKQIKICMDLLVEEQEKDRQTVLKAIEDSYPKEEVVLEREDAHAHHR